MSSGACVGNNNPCMRFLISPDYRRAAESGLFRESVPALGGKRGTITIGKVIGVLSIGICDDGPLQRAYIKLIIQEYEREFGVRFNLYEFGSGEELLEKFAESHHQFDLLFLDYRMKDITGLEAAAYIRQRNQICELVFITASEEQADFAAVSPLRILSKPAQPAAIYEILDMVSAARRSLGTESSGDCDGL